MNTRNGIASENPSVPKRCTARIGPNVRQGKTAPSVAAETRTLMAYSVRQTARAVCSESAQCGWGRPDPTPGPRLKEGSPPRIALPLGGAFNGSMQHEPDEEVSWCDDVARA